MSEVAARAGLGRALIGYHFNSRAALLEAAVTRTLETNPPPATAGLKGLFGWFQEKLTRAERREPDLLALLRLASDAAAEPAISEIRHALRRRQSGLVRRHLESAAARGEIGVGLNTDEVASTLLALLYGELLRITAGAEPASAVFLSLLESALAPRPPQSKSGAPTGPRSTAAQLDFFGKS